MWFVALLKLEGQCVRLPDAELSGRFVVLGNHGLVIDGITVNGRKTLFRSLVLSSQIIFTRVASSFC